MSTEELSPIIDNLTKNFVSTIKKQKYNFTKKMFNDLELDYDYFLSINKKDSALTFHNLGTYLHHNKYSFRTIEPSKSLPSLVEVNAFLKHNNYTRCIILIDTGDFFGEMFYWGLPDNCYRNSLSTENVLFDRLSGPYELAVIFD